jgi:hypothetical protein
MPLFTPKDPAEGEAAHARQQAVADADRARRDAMYEWAYHAATGDLAAELMGAFHPEGTTAGLKDLRMRLGCWESKYRELSDPIEEALQLLEHSELVCLRRLGDVPHWGATRFGLTILADGKDAVRQRIRERTGQ